MWPRLVSVAIGVWLMAAPAVLGYSGVTAAEASDRIVGPLVVSNAIVAIWPELRPLRWVNATLGTWLLVGVPAAAVLVDWPVPAVVNSLLCGAVTVVTARVRGELDTRFGGGWRSVWRDDIDTVTGQRREG